MTDITKRATFYARDRGSKTFHIEADGCVVNIIVGLVDSEGHQVTRVDIVPDDRSRGGDGSGRIWFQAEGDPRIIRLHDWEITPGMPRDCKCGEPELVTCGGCTRKWCDRCTPTPSARCPFEYEHED